MYFYSERFPKVDDIVMCYVRKVNTEGIYVDLLEYNNINGFVPLNEVSKVRVKNIKKILDEDKIYPLLVISVDEIKGYIDLSNKFIGDPEETNNFVEKYNRYKKCVGIIKGFTTTIIQDTQEYIEKILHPVPRNLVIDFLIECKRYKENVNKLNINEEFKEKFYEYLQSHLQEDKYNVIYTIAIQSTDLDGLKNIKEVLKTVPNDIQVRLLNSPNYTISIHNTIEKDQAINKISEALVDLEKKLIDKNCIYRQVKDEVIKQQN